MPSAVIKDRHYDQRTHTLFITFPSGDVYAYAEVEPEAWAAMNQVFSKGQFFGDFIRPYYAYGKVEDPAAVTFHPAERPMAERPPLPTPGTRRAGRGGPPRAGAGR